MRVVTRAVAADPRSWDVTTSASVRATFDRLACEWHTRDRPDRLDALADAWDRGRAWLGHTARPGLCLEPGSGIGLGTGWLAERCDAVVALDLAQEMLVRAPSGPGHRLRTDAARLPFADGAADAVVLVNALLFGEETARVLAPGGLVVWVNTSGEGTPIHLPAEEVEGALPGRWDGVASAAAGGTWAVFARR